MPSKKEKTRTKGKNLSKSKKILLKKSSNKQLKALDKYDKLKANYNNQVRLMHEASDKGDSTKSWDHNRNMDKLQLEMNEALRVAYAGEHTPAFKQDMVQMEAVELELNTSFDPDDSSYEYDKKLPTWRDFRNYVTDEESDLLDEKRRNIDKLIQYKYDEHWWSNQPSWHRDYDRTEYRNIVDSKSVRSEMFRDEETIRFDDIVQFQEIKGVTKLASIKKGKKIEALGKWNDNDFYVKEFKEGKIYSASMEKWKGGRSRIQTEYFVLVYKLDKEEMDYIRLNKFDVIDLYYKSKKTSDYVTILKALEEIKQEKKESKALQRSYRKTETFTRAGGLLDSGGWNLLRLKDQEKALKEKRDQLKEEIKKG